MRKCCSVEFWTINESYFFKSDRFVDVNVFAPVIRWLDVAKVWRITTRIFYIDIKKMYKQTATDICQFLIKITQNRLVRKKGVACSFWYASCVFLCIHVKLDNSCMYLYRKLIFLKHKKYHHWKTLGNRKKSVCICFWIRRNIYTT